MKYMALILCFLNIAYSQDAHQFNYGKLISAYCYVRTSKGNLYFSDDKAFAITFTSDSTIKAIRIKGEIVNSIELNLEEFLTLKDAVDSCKVENIKKIEGIGKIENNYVGIFDKSQFCYVSYCTQSTGNYSF